MDTEEILSIEVFESAWLIPTNAHTAVLQKLIDAKYHGYPAMKWWTIRHEVVSNTNGYKCHTKEATNFNQHQYQDI